MRRLMGVAWGLGIGILGWGPASEARVDIGPRPVSAELSWFGDDLSWSQDFCVQSTQEPNAAGTTVLPYAVEVAGPLALSQGGESIPLTLSWQDLTAGVTVPLTADVASSETLSGAVLDCPQGDNGRLVATVAAEAVMAVPPGEYAVTLRVTVANSGGGRNSFFSNVTLTLMVPDAVRLSGLRDIDLGHYGWDGMDLGVERSLCVYRASGGEYGVTAYASSPGGDFTLVNGLNQVPFQLSWNDGTGYEPMMPGVLLANRSQSVSTSGDCLGGALNNAWLRVEVPALAIEQSAPRAGSYATQLTLMIEMQ
ncbi:hypothetical protein [Halomonas sp. 328]|uniref:hypothetical protein n=1 Tax=Halomonas sp. 328 TaxID=2776704 RepID=UPI0018A6FE4E|nr:hypothetical protein [Halomonas sp. 328]MBF8224186.1 hypothetical protein [Halomonas sp. 328]